MAPAVICTNIYRICNNFSQTLLKTEDEGTHQPHIMRPYDPDIRATRRYYNSYIYVINIDAKAYKKNTNK